MGASLLAVAKSIYYQIRIISMKSNTTRIHFLEDINEKNVSCKCTGGVSVLQALL